MKCVLTLGSFLGTFRHSVKQHVMMLAVLW